VPVGFAHGYQVLSESADVVYRCSGYYDPGAERELDSGDPALAIPWPDGPVRRSDRDRRAPRLADVAETLPFTFAR
jgi:dTDP-4-dehydrorhamnose 3,5-epimerase